MLYSNRKLTIFFKIDWWFLWLSVRSNGTDIELEDCTNLIDKTCPTMDMTTVQKKNCKEDHQCTRLDAQFRCERGQCWNITTVYRYSKKLSLVEIFIKYCFLYSCKWDPEDVDPAVDCGKKRNCVELEGMYDCHNGHCSKINKVIWKSIFTIQRILSKNHMNTFSGCANDDVMKFPWLAKMLSWWLVIG